MQGRTATQTRKQSLADQLILAGLLGIVAFVILTILAWLGFQITYSGRIFPGLSVAGVDVSGLSPEAAAAKLTQAFNFPQTGRIFLQDGENGWKTTPAELGLFLDPQASVKQAYLAGRRGNLVENFSEQMSNLNSPIGLAPILVVDERMAYRYLESIAKQINKPVIETSLGLNGMEVNVRPGQKGRELDIQATLAILTTQVKSLSDGIVPLVVKETPPLVGDVTAQAELVRLILSAPLKLSMPDGQPDQATKGPWTIEQNTLLTMLSIEQVTGEDSKSAYEVTVKSELLRTFLKNLAPTLTMDPKNARLTFNDTTKKLEVIEHAVIGRSLDLEGSIRAIREKVSKGQHNIPLELTINPPAVTDDKTGDDLGIRELVRAETSFFYGSSADRVKNIQAAAGKFHGLVFAPGATISMADILGDISLDNGYAEALIIINGRTIKGVGGGVCQVSTTLFRTAFFAGFPIVQRYAHAYRVSYYEKVAGNKINSKLAGLDATVFVPLVDFKFKNDSASWLLMETYVNPANSSITWKFYSTSDGRKVTWDSTGPVNIVKAPPPVYRENPDLPKDKVVQVDWAADGADVTVTRQVIRDGKTILNDTIRTHYLPWANVYEYGPGTDVPTPEPTQ
jgi:vancomycin resistance protein YoaR